MKIIISVSISILLMFSCKSDKIEDIKQNYPTGELSRTLQKINGKMEGPMTDYYVSGGVKGIRMFKNDKQDGKSIFYYEDGTLKEVQYYQNGEKTGGDTVYHENGKLKFTLFLKDNKKDGYMRKWGEDGGLIYESKYSMDTIIEVNGKPIQ
jgi:antitoxin component YwqK of YwqJK toxin-antitoxin module